MPLQSNYWNKVKNESSRCPQLFIYSNDDRLVSAEDVEEVADHRQKLGVSVQRYKLAKSPHVAHLRTNKDSYIAVLRDFLKRS
mmetsp:Transcript_1629/g.2650  ORF Transcript_1629/g.2650 Transcript_1629/m.2650 type:complete len:83 (-) Transcript_1629:761-1009(-)